jgi:hypothetical protein
MPYKMEPSDGGYRVVNSQTGRVHAKHTTKEKAIAQMRLMNATEHGWVPGAKAKK